MSAIVIVTYSDYPKGSPGAIRYHSFAQTYAQMGYDVMVLNKSCSSKDGKIQSKPIAFCRNKYQRFFLFCYKAIQTLKKLYIASGIDAVIIGADVMAIYASVIQNWCRRRNINCVFDATEWYSKEQFINWRTSFDYWEKDCLNRLIINKHSRVIAISSYLYDYFEKKGCKVTLVPIVYNCNANSNICLSRERNSDGLNIIYAGSHILMDNIPLIIEAIALLPEHERSQVHFSIYGLRMEQIAQFVSSDILDQVVSSVHIMGRQPNSEVIKAYSRSDFSILLRDPSLRVNKAGFPSKVVESMRLGTPVICNHSSDLDQYVIHNENSIVVDTLTPYALSEQFQSLLSMPKNDIAILGNNAAQTIALKLDSSLFESKLKDIIL